MSKSLVFFVMAGLLLVPAAPVPAQGLKGEYFSPTAAPWTPVGKPVLTRVEVVNFNWGGNAPDPLVGVDSFTVRWTGGLKGPVTGSYQIRTRTDDGIRVWINGVSVIDNWTDHSATWDAGRIDLEAGKKYQIRVEFYENGGDAVCELYWSYPGRAEEVIPGSALSPEYVPLVEPRLPDPPNGAVGVVTPLMSWTKGETAVWQDVYFGTDKDAVTNATTDSPEYKGRQMYMIYYHVPGLESGVTYYWRVDQVEASGTVLKGPVWSFSAEPLKAFRPNPADGATGQLPGMILTWLPGKAALSHQVYFGMDMAAVASGDASVDKGTVDEEEFNTGELRASTTYYWRIDAIKQDGVEPGEVWSFSTVDTGPANKIMYQTWQGIGGTAISNLTDHADYPDNPTTSEYVDLFQSPVDWADNYGQRLWGWLKPPQTGDYTFWIAGDDEQQLWLSTDGSPTNVVRIANVPGWTPAFDWDNTGGGSSNADAQESDPIPLVAGKKYFIMALGKEGTGGDSTAVAWQGGPVTTREVIKAQYVDMFSLPPLQAFGPYPANGAVDTPQVLVLEWNAGASAQQHEVYFGDDADAVAAADTSSPLFMGRQAGTPFDAGALEWGKTFYWRIDEINDGDPDSPWKGPLWRFTTATFLPIDDFESYTDNMDAGEAIWQTWIDGLTNGTGSIVGYFDAVNGTFCETTVVHGGSQSMPFDYNNVVPPYYSEAELPLDPTQDWTVEGVDTLSLWVRGFPVSFVETADGITMSAAGADIYNLTDEFRYAWKRLSGDGSISVRVDSLDNVNTWTKAGVMIRESLAPAVKAAHMIVSPTGRVEFQYREFSGTNTTQPSLAEGSVTLPCWVRLTRTGDTFKGEYSTDGTTWQTLPAAAGGSTATLTMPASVYVGLAVTSHVAGTSAVAQFSNVNTSASISGTWQVADIGVDHPGNGRADLYVGIQDSSNKSVFVVNPDPAAVNVTEWTEWKVPLTDFAGVNLAKVNRLYIGIGDRKSPTQDGSGMLYIDDIRVTKPEPEPAE